MNITKDDLDVLISEERVQSRLKELGAQVDADYSAGGDLHVIGVLKGSFLVMADLVRNIDMDLSVDFLGVSSYGTSTKSSGVVRMTQDLSLPIKGRDVLIVEDIIDTGLTLKYLVENLKTRQPRSIKVLTLLDKPANRKVDFTPDYIGFEIPDEFVIGYGLDYEEFLRHIPFIGVYRKG